MRRAHRAREVHGKNLARFNAGGPLSRCETRKTRGTPNSVHVAQDRITIHAPTRWDAHQHVLPFVYTRRGGPHLAVERIRCRFLPLLTCKITYPLLFFGTSSKKTTKKARWGLGRFIYAYTFEILHVFISSQRNPLFASSKVSSFDGNELGRSLRTKKKVTILRQSRPRLCSCEATARHNSN